MGYFELRIQVSRPTSAVLYWTWLLDNSFTPCALSSLECLTIFLKRIDVARTRKTFGQHTDKRHAEREMNFFSPSVSGSDGRQITREFKKKRKPPGGHRLFPFISVYWNAVPQNDWKPTTRFDQLRPQKSFHWRQHTANDDIKTETREEVVGWQPAIRISIVNKYVQVNYIYSIYVP